DFLHCYDAFRPDSFSIVPFFLCCRAIELSFKALHLETRSQANVKSDFRHDLKASYEALPLDKQLLTRPEVELLNKANVLYKAKAFEYVQPFDAGTAYSHFPTVEDLARLAKRVVAL